MVDDETVTVSENLLLGEFLYSLELLVGDFDFLGLFMVAGDREERPGTEEVRRGWAGRGSRGGCGGGWNE